MTTHINLDNRTSPDNLIRSYLNNIENRGAPGARLVDGEGRKYRKTCRARVKATKTTKGRKVCGSKLRHYKSTDKIYVCGQCGAAWRYDDRLLLKGTVQVTPRPGAVDHRMADEASIGLLFDRFMEEKATYWHARIYVLKIVQEVGDEHLSRIGRKHVPGFPHPWTEWQIRKSVSLARTAWRSKLLRAGIRIS